MISSYLLSQPANRFTVTPSWATIDDWLAVIAGDPVATPLVDFGKKPPLMRIGVTALNWYLMDLMGLRARWYDDGWLLRDELWLLINPLRYRLLGHQPRRPYAHDVRDYLHKIAPQLLREPLHQHPYFAVAPAVYRHKLDDNAARRKARQAPWNRVAVLGERGYVMGMVWEPGSTTGGLPPILKHPGAVGSVTYSN